MDNIKESRLSEFIADPKKAIWKLSLPMMFGMMVQAVYMLVDTAFIGKWVGGSALAALGYVFPVFFIIFGLTFGLDPELPPSLLNILASRINDEPIMPLSTHYY